MPNVQSILDSIKLFLSYVFGNNTPSNIPFLLWVAIKVGFTCLVLLYVISLALSILGKIQDAWKQHILPLFYNQEEKYRSDLRRLFAMHIDSELSRISAQEDWEDYYFAELEAEVEARGRRKVLGIIPLPGQIRSGLRREKSLSVALKQSSERVILLEGEPGSGKSVALRHVAQKMAQKAQKMRSTRSIIPIYVNLRLLDLSPNKQINRETIENFVKSTIKRNNHRDVNQFLEREFDDGIRQGLFFFLFDSFDELPEVLSSIEADEKINEYGEAIDDFLRGMGQCKGIVASRFYRGPIRFHWTRFRILPLNEKRQLELISKAKIEPKRRHDLIGHLGNASQSIHSMVCNPFFLSLLCKHIARGHLFPESAHVIFETYIDQRFEDDKYHIQQEFQFDVAQVRSAAESIAFCMLASSGLGLSPTREDLQRAMKQLCVDIGNSFEVYLNALQYMKLARPDIAANTSQSISFTFSHRRFQEYFATCFVLRDHTKIPPEQLLSDGRWRETAVVLFQTQDKNKLTPLIEQAEQLLILYCRNVPDLIDDTARYLLDRSQDGNLNRVTPSEFFWPAGSIHLLSLLQDGFSGRLEDLPNTVREYAGRLILSAFVTGMRRDNKWALEVAGIAPESVLEYLLKQVFSTSSQWLVEVAYRQAARLKTISPDIAKGIRNALLYLASSGQLYQERYTTEAYVRRLSLRTDFLSVLKLLLWLPFINKVLIFMQISILCLFVFQYRSYFIITSLWVFPMYIAIIYTRLPFTGSQNVSTPSIIKRYQSHYVALSVLMSFFGYVFIKNVSIPFYMQVANFYSALFLTLEFGPIRTGKFSKTRWWPLIPIWVLLYCITNVHAISVLLRKKKTYIAIRMGGLILLVFAGIIGLLLGVAYWWITVVSVYNQLLYKTVNVLLIGILIASFLLIYFRLIFFALDYLRWITWKRDSYSLATAQELLEVFEGYYYPQSYCHIIIKHIRAQQMLKVKKETITCVKGIIFDLETDQKNGYVNRKMLSSEKLKSGLKDNILKYKIKKALDGHDVLLLHADDQTIDELNLLMEDMIVDINNYNLFENMGPN